MPIPTCWCGIVAQAQDINTISEVPVAGALETLVAWWLFIYSVSSPHSSVHSSAKYCLCMIGSVVFCVFILPFFGVRCFLV